MSKYRRSLTATLSHTRTHKPPAAEESVCSRTPTARWPGFGLDTGEGHTDRVTFVLADDEVKAVYDPEMANPEGHAAEVLNDTRNEYVQGGCGGVCGYL